MHAEPFGQSQSAPADPTRGLTTTLLLVAVTRLPFLWTGYGSDNDAWLIACAADRLWRTGVYSVSRFPGFPLYEFLSAPFVGIGGSILSNFMTLAASTALLSVWFHIARQYLIHARLLVLTLACTPLFWINSAATMDYVWSLLFLILSLNATLQSRIIMSGVMLGIAVGFRLPTIVAVIPLLLLLYYRELPLRRMLLFVAAAGIVTFIAYTPLLVTYGPLLWWRLTQSEMSDVHPAWPERLKFFCYRSAYALGPIALLAFCTIIVSNRQQLKQRMRTRDPLLIASVTGIAAYLLLFLFFPLERAYLLPAIFFGLVLIGSVSSRTQLLIFAACSASFCFFNPDIIRHQGEVGTPGLNIHGGLVVEEFQKRQHLLEDRAVIAAIQVGGEAMIMTGGGAAFWFQNEYVEPDTAWQREGLGELVVRNRTNHSIHYTAKLSPIEIARVRSRGCTVYCLDTAQGFIERITGTTMVQQGVTVLHR